jgi:hypothetical protein
MREGETTPPDALPLPDSPSDAFIKKLENFEAAVALNFVYHNF